MHKPQYINGSALESFAYFTVTQRFPFIIDLVIDSNSLSGKQKQKLEELKSEIKSKEMKLLPHCEIDSGFWNEMLSKHAKSWLDAPFMFVEFYFYRRLLEAVDYFENKNDPFKIIKINSLRNSLAEAFFIANTISNLKNPLEILLKYDLWSNRADFSQMHRHDSLIGQNIIIDDTENVLKLFQAKLGQVDIVLDNSGLELSVDLLVSYHLINERLAERVFIHAKSQPIFVSDATREDVLYAVEFFAGSEDYLLQEAGKKLKGFIEKGMLVIEEDPFWVLPKAFEEINGSLRDHFAKSELIILKGDLNYRRLVEDRQWAFNTDISQLIGYLPTNILVIRALKSELMVGLSDETVKRLFDEDPRWMINGKYGIIQLFKREEDYALHRSE